MSTYTTDKASPFTRAVVASMRKLYALCFHLEWKWSRADVCLLRYPEALAEKSWDNTGCEALQRIV